MATREEMCKMINAMEDKDQGWIARHVVGNPDRFPGSILKEITWQALCQAEEEGMSYSGTDGEKLYTYWEVGAYEVSYITYDKVLYAEMLTEEMMDDLIIEEVE